MLSCCVPVECATFETDRDSILPVGQKFEQNEVSSRDKHTVMHCKLSFLSTWACLFNHYLKCVYDRKAFHLCTWEHRVHTFRVIISLSDSDADAQDSFGFRRRCKDSCLLFFYCFVLLSAGYSSTPTLSQGEVVCSQRNWFNLIKVNMSTLWKIDCLVLVNDNHLSLGDHFYLHRSKRRA